MLNRDSIRVLPVTSSRLSWHSRTENSLETGMEGYRSPEDAAMVGFPPDHCRVLASHTEGDEAFVLLDTGSVGQRYLYGVSCIRRAGRWYESSSGNGSGWSSSEADQDLGTWSLWDEAPTGADRVRVEFSGESSEHPIDAGVYLVVWFRRPVRPAPRVTAFRINGTWVPKSDWLAMWMG